MAITAQDMFGKSTGDRPVDRTRLVIVSGCSGGGKSTLLEEMARRGYQVFPEVGRQIVKEQLQSGGRGLPWDDALRFVELAANRAVRQYRSAGRQSGPALFDRSVVDVVFYLEFKGLQTPDDLKRLVEICRYAPDVFMTPPWPEIFESDAERPKDFAEAVSEYQALAAAYRDLGYRIIDIPKMQIGARADFLEERLAVIAPMPPPP